MAKPVYGILMLAWALWLGGLVALLLFVTRLFQASRPVAIEAAPVLFVTFASYQIIVGTIACAAGTLLTVLSRRNVHAVMTLLLLAALATALLNRGWTHEMETMRRAGQSDSPQFKGMHAKTSIAYTSAAGLLLVAGVGLILTAPPPRTGQETSRARGFPVVPADRSQVPPVSPGHAPLQ